MVVRGHQSGLDLRESALSVLTVLLLMYGIAGSLVLVFWGLLGYYLSPDPSSWTAVDWVLVGGAPIGLCVVRVIGSIAGIKRVARR